MDEKSKQLLGEIFPVLPHAPGKLRRRDSEYRRNGTANIFCAVEPKGGRHFTRVTRRRTRRDFALFIRKIVKAYPNAKTIHLVMDNLNTHGLKSLIEAFGERKGKALWRRLTVHYTPNHGSWLNQAEIEIGLLCREAFGKRRFADITELRSACRPWTIYANRKKRKINWTFSRNKARQKFGYKAPIT